ncbi:MAG: N-acetylmuramic acid 6-phosphate etherase [Bacillota bacterium]
MDRQNLPKTEAVNPLTRDIDTWPAIRIVEAINAEDHRVAPAVGREVQNIARAVEMVAAAIKGGKRVFYLGSGTSGRLGVLDASEIEPTYGAAGKRFVALISGGSGAVFKAVEGAEDSIPAGREAISQEEAGTGDVVVGIASSGSTPFVVGALQAAREMGATTVALVGDASGMVAASAELVIAPDVGPEVIAGSTRMKNGTAQKLVLNMISTAGMIMAGRTYSNLMAGTSPKNIKLSGRARRILIEATEKTAGEVEAAFTASKGDIGVALVSLRRGIPVDEAAGTLEKHRGAIREAALGVAPLPSAPQMLTPSPRLRFGSAGEAGLDEVQVERAFGVVGTAVGDGEGDIPGAVAAIVHNGTVVGPRAFGWAVRTPERIPATPFTVFDMASLTKVLATTPSVLIACERGLFRLDDPVAVFIPEFASGGKERITLRHLLTHTSGLPGHIKFWEQGLRGEEIVKFISGLGLAQGAEPGKEVVYSDLGFIILAEVLLRTTGSTVDKFAAKEVFGPLGMADTGFLPSPDRRNKIAATEYRPDLGRVMWGEVHDENALALGGVAGHAGLFSTVEDVARYALMWLGQGEWQGVHVLSRSCVAAAITEETSAGERRGLGWMLKPRRFSSGGDLISPRSFGHTGFTGTSLWCDPETGTAVILLTNRVHAGREANATIRLRPRFANAAVAAIR